MLMVTYYDHFMKFYYNIPKKLKSVVKSPHHFISPTQIKAKTYNSGPLESTHKSYNTEEGQNTVMKPTYQRHHNKQGI